MSISKEVKPQAAPTAPTKAKIFGFKNWSTFWLWAVIGGYFAAFNIWNMRKLDFEGSFQTNALPGEYSWMKRTAGYKTLFRAHLACVLPCSVIGLLQFVPQLRRNYMSIHRSLGEAFFLMMGFGAPSGIMVAVHAFGAAENPSVRLSIMLTGVLTICFLAASYFCISTNVVLSRLRYKLHHGPSNPDARVFRRYKAIDIRRHREFIIRTLAVMSTGSFSSVYLIIPEVMNWTLGYVAFSCGTLMNDLGVSPASAHLQSTYPACMAENGGHAGTIVAVKADLSGSVEELTAWGRAGIGMAFWAALVMHMVLAEIYIRITAKDDDRSDDL
ncbi:uncharacterized protein N7515_000713 [Penicillium bovifimosum]|uniref:Uncharacterized protein n=1 Tax=Penicillium bovifimosum TaxID=126998 RepID=A0A9W9HGJ0_9EURO|nr:uncharacterized protein N7515_000713 [Penicillium bovifimosum]KAJ5146149.1 hypothetical protein N7515_000713 [Penicillium bovifimosum]